MPDEDRSELERKIAALEAQINPPPLPPRQAPRDYSKNLSMPREALAQMAQADVGLDAIVRDLRAGPAAPASLAHSRDAGPTRDTVVRSNNGWQPEIPLPLTPPGSKIIDRLIDAQDAKDRAERGR